MSMAELMVIGAHQMKCSIVEVIDLVIASIAKSHRPSCHRNPCGDS